MQKIVTFPVAIHAPNHINELLQAIEGALNERLSRANEGCNTKVCWWD